MTWLELEMQSLNFCAAAIMFAANWLLQSTLLIGVGLLAAWLLRRRGSAFQSVVYRTTLSAVLLGPIVSIAMAFGGLDGWSVKLPPAFDYRQVRSSESTGQALPSNEVADTPELNAHGQPNDDWSGFAAKPQKSGENAAEFGSIGSVDAGSQNSASGIAVVSNEAPGPAVSDDSSTAVADRTVAVSTTADVWLLQIHGFGLLTVGLVIGWILVSGIFAIRLAAVMRQMSRLRDCSATASRDEIEICQRIALEMKIAAPQVLRAPFLTSPFLHGVRRPAVMLPEEATLPLLDIFVHELAHLSRHDCFWLLLRQLATIVMFFQPLLLWLGRRMDATAEEVCDDVVVQFGGNRERYANSLVDIAALSARPMAIVGVGMVSLRSMLSQRVGRIMDTSRSLSTRVGNLLLVLVMSGGLAGTMIAGFVGLSPKSAATVATSVQNETSTEPQDDASKGDSDESAQTQEQAISPVVAESTNSPQVESASDPQPEGVAEIITGRVISHNGKPVAGAKLLWYRTRVHDLDPMMPKLLAESDNDGKFSFAPPTIPNPETQPASWDFQERIAIVAPKHGFKIVTPNAFKQEKSESLLETIANAVLNSSDNVPGKLPAEGQPLRGRIVNIEGAPVVGATVRIRYHSDRSSSRYDREDLEARDSKDAEWRSWLSNLLNVIEPVPERFALPSTTTDANGEFELTSLPEDCLFQLLLEGEGIQSTDIIAHNADGEKIVVEAGRQSTEPPITIYRNNFLCVVGPSNPVVGRVIDLDTGEPVPNAVVRAFTVHGEAVYSTRERQHFATRADNDGRYRITGLPIGDGNRLSAFTTDDIAYIPLGTTADTSNAHATKPDHAIELNFALKRCVWAKGRIIDGETGNPFKGEMSYYWFRDQALEDAIPGLRGYNTDGLYFTNIHGEFRIPVLPTRGILAYRWDGDGFQQPSPIDKFPRGLGAEKIDGKDEQMSAYPTMPHYLMAGNYNFVSEINPQPGDKEIEATMVLQASKPVHLKIVADDGIDLPANGYHVYGLNERWGWQNDQTTEPIVEDLLPNETRKVFAFHREAGLAGGVLVDENVTQPVEIKLVRSGGVKGRLVDKNGDVITDGVISVDYEKLQSGEKYAIWMNHPKLSANPTQIPVDEQSRFELDGLIPGWKYSARVSAPRKMQGRMMEMGIGMAFVDIEINPGETRDLGDLVVGYPEKEPADDAKKKETPTTSGVTKPAAAENQTAFTGSVIGPDDKPIADARVSIIARPMGSTGLLEQMEAIAETTANSDGTFTIAVNGEFTKTHQQPQILVRKDGFGVAGQRVEFSMPSKVAPLKLLDEEIMTGRCIDIEGQPVAGLVLLPSSFVNPEQAPLFEDTIVVEHDRTLDARTDENGQFSIRGVSVGHGVSLNVEGNDRIAPQSILLNTGLPEERGERDFMYRPIVRNLKPGEDAVITLAPAQIFEGTIRYADTKEPVPNTKIGIWASQQRHGSMSTVDGQTDANGRYHISAKPGIRFGIQAYAPDGVPYLNRQTPLNKSIEWKAGDRIRELDFELPRGVLVRGTITEAGTTTPVADAYVQYAAESANNKSMSDDILTGWQAMQRSDKDGKFEIAVLQGPGRLLISTPGHDHILKQIGSKEIYASKKGGERNYVHAFERIDPQPNSEPLDVQITVERGKHISGRVVNADGAAPEELIAVSILDIWPSSMTWSGNSELAPALNGRFELGGLADGVEYKTHFLDAKNKLGAMVLLTSASDDPTITLEPCGTAMARFVDAEGQPVINYSREALMIVLTPGANRFDRTSMLMGLLAADSDFVVNVDRRNHSIDNESDAQGRMTYTALIPGATYELQIDHPGNPIVKSFVAKSGETIDVGVFVVNEEE